ncbi:MAG: MMPL family transporter [Anaerolineae bacterium]|nr:MMPL family transporter [Anaerolineae bacterium]
MGDTVMTISSIATVLIVVVIYGAGTDYNLFLISRFREELQNGTDGDKRTATRTTVQHIGESIFNSAATTVTGFLAMAFTQFGLFNTTGPILAVSILVTLLVSMTLTPAVLSLLGMRTFWPRRLATMRQNATNHLYVGLANTLRRYPAPIAALLLAGAIPLALYGVQYQVTYDFFDDLPDDVESVRGFRLLEEHIGPGEMQPVTLLSTVEGDDLLVESARLTESIAAVEGVATVRSGVQPFGAAHPTAGFSRLDVQLTTLGNATAPADAEPTPEQQEMFDALLADLPAYLDQVAEADPALAENPAYDDARTALGAEAGPDLPQLSASLLALAEAAQPRYLPLETLPAGVGAMFGGAQMSGLVNSFINADENVLRFEIVLADSPSSNQAMDTIEALLERLAGETVATVATGGTAVSLDLRQLIAEDLLLTVVLVLSGIFIILAIMLRSLVAPVYLVGTIVLSYTTTLGMTRIASDVLFDAPELVFWVPFMIFVFLVALGIDYSIYLFSRIKEEIRKGHPMTEAVTRSVAIAGSIIAMAGLIVAGSFIALTTGNIVGLQQVGFAVGVGILVDTIIVRSVLVPAIAILVGKWSWWPGPMVAATQRSAQSAHDKRASQPELAPVEGR